MSKSDLEKKMQTFFSTLQEQKELGLGSHFNEIWMLLKIFNQQTRASRRVESSFRSECKKVMNYYQIGAPADFEDPYEEDLGHIHL
jgi:hypothetical protein